MSSRGGDEPRGEGERGDSIAPASSESLSQAPREYDLFVLFAGQDEPFVKDFLVPSLRLPAGRVLLSSELTPGASIIAEIERGITRSAATLVVLSPAHMRDRMAKFGDDLGVHASLAGTRLIPLLLAPCKLPLRFRSLVTVDFTDRARWEEATSRLRASLDVPSIPPASGRASVSLPTVSDSHPSAAPSAGKKALAWALSALVTLLVMTAGVLAAWLGFARKDQHAVISVAEAGGALPPLVDAGTLSASFEDAAVVAPIHADIAPTAATDAGAPNRRADGGPPRHADAGMPNCNPPYTIEWFEGVQVQKPKRECL